LKRWTIIFIGFVSLLALLYYFAPLYEPEEDISSQLKTSTVKQGDLTVAVTATGTVRPYVEVDVKSKASGEIISFPFNEGDEVEKGRVVVRLDPEDETSNVNQARAELLMAEGKLERARVSLKDTELRLERQKQLFEKGVISRQDFDAALIAHDKAKSEVKIARAELAKSKEGLKEAEDRLEDTEIRAPLRGTILEKFVEEGQVISSTLSSVTEGTLLLTMADLNRIYVEAMVDEVDIGRVATGQEVSISVDSWPDRVFEGRVKRISPKGRLERTVTVFDVVIDIIWEAGGKAGEELRPGMSANVEIVTDSIEGVLLVPSEAIRKKERETGVFSPGEDGALWVKVRTGKTDGVFTEVINGLKAGDVVILSGLKKEKNEGAGRGRWRFLRYHWRKK
jgi:HlyD family secretion protein